MAIYAHQLETGAYVLGYGIVTDVTFPDDSHVCMHYAGKKGQDVVVTFKNNTVIYLKVD